MLRRLYCTVYILLRHSRGRHQKTRPKSPETWSWLPTWRVGSSTRPSPTKTWRLQFEGLDSPHRVSQRKIGKRDGELKGGPGTPWYPPASDSTRTGVHCPLGPRAELHLQARPCATRERAQGQGCIRNHCRCGGVAFPLFAFP